MVLEKILESPLDCKEIQPVHSIFFFTLQYCIGFAIHQHEYTTEYYLAIKKNIFESVLMWWMRLEPIIQSEVSQKEKHQYNILMHIYGI